MTTTRHIVDDLKAYGVMGNLRPHVVAYDPDDPACLSRDEAGRLTFRFLAADDVAEAMVVVRNEGHATGYDMRRVGAADRVSLWEVTIEPSATRLEYSLALRLEDGTAVYVGVTGVTGAIERVDRLLVEVADVPCHDVPGWAPGAIIYQIFPDRFASGDPTLTPPDALPWGDPPTPQGFMGGDLAGIVEHLDHLVDLGVGIVYLTPIFASPSNHRYDARDYHTVDPMLGGNEALHRLVAAAHERGLRIMLDTSLNHVHPSFPPFADVIDRGPDSPYASWFDVREYPPAVRYRPDLVAEHPYWADRLQHLADETGLSLVPVDEGPAVAPTYDAWYGVPAMPRVDLSDPGARRYMIDIATHWVTEYGVDAWRMDVVRYIDHDFWADFRRDVRAARDDVFLLAEVMGDSRRWLGGDEFDSMMNYTFREICLDFFARRSISAEEFAADYLRLLAAYSPAVTTVAHNLIGSHDTPRFLRLADEDVRRLLLATTFQLTTPGAPGLYYGDELPLTGGEDPDCRRGFEWDRTGGPHHVAVASLARLRAQNRALRTGNITLLPTVDQAIAYVRDDGDVQMFVAINNGATTVDLGVGPGGTPGAISWSIGDVASRGSVVELGAHSAVVVTVDRAMEVVGPGLTG